MWLWLVGCPHPGSTHGGSSHGLVDRVEPPGCAVARQQGSREAWAAAFWADPEHGCRDEALNALRRIAPETLGLMASGTGSTGMISGDGRVPKAVQQLLQSISAPPPRVWLDGSFAGVALDSATASAFEPVRAAVDGCVAPNVSGRVRLLGAIGPNGLVRLGAIDGDDAIARCVTGLDDLELSPATAPRPLDLTIQVDRG